MNAELVEKCLVWCFDEIIREACSTGDPEARCKRVIGRANLGATLLAGNEAIRDDLWESLSEELKERIQQTRKGNWSKYTPEGWTAENWAKVRKEFKLN